MWRDKTTCAVALLWVILLGARATTRAQRPVAPDRSTPSRSWRGSWLPPPPFVFWRAGRDAHVSRRHRFNQFFGPGLAYAPWSRPGYYWYHGGGVPYFFPTPVKDFYAYAETVAVPSRSESLLGEWVAEWKDREPGENRSNQDLSQSALLKVGMSEEDIVRAVGSPVDRRRTTEGEVWKYSSFTLVVSAGKLIALR